LIIDGLITHPLFSKRDRLDVLQNMYSENLALVSLRRSRSQDEWNNIFIGSNIIDKSYITSLDNCFVFPLYIYRDQNSHNLFSKKAQLSKVNISPDFLKEVSTKLQIELSNNSEGNLNSSFRTKDILCYIYSILHSPTYRTRYAEFLKIDFPRIPLTSDKALFAALVGKGKELVDLHLLKSPQVENFITTYPVSGDNRVDRVRYEGDKVWINPAQYFGGVPEQVWNFKIGGYQVCDKWLKDRKGRVLTSEDISHYQRVVVALNETIRLMREIDETIPKWPIE